MDTNANTKTMTITGGAAESYMNKGSKTRRRSRSTAQVQDGGFLSKKMDSVPLSLSLPLPITTPVVKPVAAAPVVGGSIEQKPVKVVLGPKAAKSQVILGPKKSTTIAVPQVQVKTRKHAKKIRMSLGGFGKRVTRANKIRFDATKQGIDDIKKVLKDAKLVKDTTKAPDTVLRGMYSDYMMLKSRAL